VILARIIATRLSPALLATASLALAFAATGCGSSKGADTGARLSSVSTISGRIVEDKDHDYDGSPTDRYDEDDYYILAYGRAASAAEFSAVTTLLKHYYAAATADDGSEACALMSAVFAHAIIGDDGTGTNVPPGHVETCAQVATSLFKHDHRQLTIDNATLKVTGVRVGEKLGYALLSFKALPDRHILIYREAGVWKVDAALDDRLT
jgi:hypothetical protein